MFQLATMHEESMLAEHCSLSEAGTSTRKALGISLAHRLVEAGRDRLFRAAEMEQVSERQNAQSSQMEPARASQGVQGSQIEPV